MPFKNTLIVVSESWDGATPLSDRICFSNISLCPRLVENVGENLGRETVEQPLDLWLSVVRARRRGGEINVCFGNLKQRPPHRPRPRQVSRWESAEGRVIGARSNGRLNCGTRSSVCLYLFNRYKWTARSSPYKRYYSRRTETAETIEPNQSDISKAFSYVIFRPSYVCLLSLCPSTSSRQGSFPRSIQICFSSLKNEFWKL